MSDSVKKEIIIGVIKGGISAIPYLGGALNEAFFDIRGRIKQNRFENFVNELSRRVQTLETSLFNETLIQSEEFGDVFETVIREVTNKKMHENLSILVDFTVEGMKSSSILEHPFIDSIIKTIASLTPSELHVLQHLRSYNIANQVKIQNGEKEIDFKLDYSKDKVLDLDKALFRMTFDSLISKALVRHSIQESFSLLNFAHFVSFFLLCSLKNPHLLATYLAK